MHKEKKKTGDHFYKKLGEGRAVSKKKQTIQSQDSNPLLLSTSSSFYYSDKKSESYLTLIQMLKSDLFQIQDMINNNTQDLKMYKLLSKVPGLSKKLSEIEEQKSISNLIENITEDSQKLDIISKIYNCKDKKQLIQKIFLELSFNELLLKKIHDLFILMKLSLHKDDTYQESLSKIISIKSFIDKTIDIINEKNNIDKNKNNKFEEDNNIFDNILKIQSLQELLNIQKSNSNIPDILKHLIKLIIEYFSQYNNSVIQKINDGDNYEFKINDKNFEGESEIIRFEEINKQLFFIINNYKILNNEQKQKNKELINNIQEKDKIIQSMNNNKKTDIINIKTEFENDKKLILEKIDKTNEKNLELENKNKLLEEEIIKLNEELNLYKEKDKNNMDLENNLKSQKDNNAELENKNMELNNKINELNNKINELNKTINELNNKIKELNNQMKNLEKNKKNNIDINKAMKDSDIIKIMNNYDNQLKKIGNDIMNKNKDEIKNLENQLKSLQSKYDMIVLERESLKKNIIFLKGKKYDPDSYEEVLKEQFETMRNAFMQKIDDLNEELNNISRNSRIKIYQLELELKENVKLKNNFLKQIISLQSQIDALNK